MYRRALSRLSAALATSSSANSRSASSNGAGVSVRTNTATPQEGTAGVDRNDHQGMHAQLADLRGPCRVVVQPCAWGGSSTGCRTDFPEDSTRMKGEAGGT